MLCVQPLLKVDVLKKGMRIVVLETCLLVPAPVSGAGAAACVKLLSPTQVAAPTCRVRFAASRWVSVKSSSNAALFERYSPSAAMEDAAPKERAMSWESIEKLSGTGLARGNLSEFLRSLPFVVCLPLEAQ